jgi:hypothetical protein
LCLDQGTFLAMPTIRLDMDLQNLGRPQPDAKPEQPSLILWNPPGGGVLAAAAGIPASAGNKPGELGAGSGRPPADPIHPALVGELGGRWRPVDRGRDTIRLRETPGNLSGSGSETHQHFHPTGANCCHSLLLGPDARIDIDLHKRLFLLVTGGGE